MENSITSKCQKLVVAAIDFGTTYSGYAFSFRDNWSKVLTNVWQGGSLISHKAPTVLLLNKEGEFVAFGYEAEDKYSHLTENGTHKDHYLFQRFKMILHQHEEFNRGIKCKDLRGKELEAIKVFAICIKYLKKQLLEDIQHRDLGAKADDIEYVLTVPAIWGDKAKMFMREAASNAGIKTESLTIALEPEAVSIYCQHLQFENQDFSASTLGVVKPGEKYMVVDLGGGTADITVHEKAEDNTLAELVPASGGPWGGKSVDDSFMKFITELAGEEAMKLMKEENMKDYVEFCRSFETKKRTIPPEKSGFTTMTFPKSYFDNSKNCHKVKDFKEVIEKSETCRDKVKSAPGKLKWQNDHFRGFFKKTIDSIVKHIDALFQETLVQNVGTILMVGGFSECEILQVEVKKHFPDKKVIIPAKAGSAVLKGAVYFGHIPQAISRRSARYTYGIQTWPPFDEKSHPESKEFDNTFRDPKPIITCKKLPTGMFGDCQETDVAINGIKTKALLDTGSSVSCMNREFYEKNFNHIPLQNSETLHKIECRNEGFIEVDLQTQGISESFKSLFLVVPERQYNRRIPLLLGTNILKSIINHEKNTSCERCLQLSIFTSPWYLAFRAMDLTDK